MMIMIMTHVAITVTVRGCSSHLKFTDSDGDPSRSLRVCARPASGRPGRPPSHRDEPPESPAAGGAGAVPPSLADDRLVTVTVERPTT